MTMRMKVLLAILLVIGALMLLDRPEPLDVSEASATQPRVPQGRLPRIRPATAVAAPADVAVPDLFATGAQGVPASVDPQARRKPDQAQSRKPASPFRLLGFKLEDGVREAIVLGGAEVSIVRAGTTLGDHYRVLALGEDAVDIKDNASGAAFRIGFEDHP